MAATWFKNLAAKLERIEIIDAHQHMGESMYSHTSTNGAQLIDGLNTYDIAKAMVMPQPNLEHPAATHDAIAETAAKNADRVFGMINLSPRFPEADFKAEVKRCVETLDFRAIKLHPLGHNVSIASKDAEIIFRTAADYDLPVLIHTGTGTPHSLPSLALRPARAFPMVKIILCHAGWSVYSDEAIVAAEAAENIYLEPSWCASYQIKAMIGTIGAERVLFGSDHLSNIPSELAKFTSLELRDDELKLCLHDNAKKLFKL